jgi:hypothetical protein
VRLAVYPLQPQSHPATPGGGTGWAGQASAEPAGPAVYLQRNCWLYSSRHTHQLWDGVLTGLRNIPPSAHGIHGAPGPTPGRDKAHWMHSEEWRTLTDLDGSAPGGKGDGGR